MAEGTVELPNNQLERTQTVIIGGKTVHMETVVISDKNGNINDENTPIHVDGDSLYWNDIYASSSDLGTFSGSIISLFDSSATTYLTDDSATNPKHFTVQLKRPITADSFGIETDDGNYSNVKIELLDAVGAVFKTVDDSGTATKRTGYCYDFDPTKFCRFKISFYTADAVKIKFLSIDKIGHVISKIQALDEDTGVMGNVTISGGDFNVLSRLRNATGNTKINPATSDIQTDGTQISQMYGKTGDATFQVPRMDVITHVLKMIDYPHSEMHGGDHYYYVDPITLGNGASQDYLITTPNTTKWGHFEFKIDSLYKITVGFHEAGDRSGTTPQTIFNNNRNSANTATLTIDKGTSGGTTDGTNIYPCTSGGASAAGKAGNIRSGDGEIILRQNTKYILRITSGAASNDMCVKVWWYEHTNRTA